MQLHLAGFTQEEIAEKVGMHRSVVCRDLQSARDVCRSGDSPDLEVVRFTQMAIRKRGQAPYTLYEVEARYTTSGLLKTRLQLKENRCGRWDRFCPDHTGSGLNREAVKSHSPGQCSAALG